MREYQATIARARDEHGYRRWAYVAYIDPDVFERFVNAHDRPFPLDDLRTLYDAQLSEQAQTMLYSL